MASELDTDRIYVAIGDVHGERARLAALHEAVFEHLRFFHDGAPATLVHLGDYVDRGPDSAGVLEDIIGLQNSAETRDDLEVVALLGNHEQMMIDARDKADSSARDHWRINGGAETMRSYDERDEGDERLAAHLRWLKRLPTMWRDEARGLVFVHSGIDPATFPDCDDHVRIWTRSRKFFSTDGWPRRAELAGLTVIHGHTPTEDDEPDVRPGRINIDTGAVYGGKLTAVILAPGAEPRFLST